MLICVDGTGPWSDQAYSMRMSHSYVRSIFRHSALRHTQYHRGPEISGLGPKLYYAQNLVGQIQKYWTRGDRQIFLVGYSRGAAIVTTAADLLRTTEMPGGSIAKVEGLFLFDAVCRSPELTPTELVPDNVIHCYHAIRDDRANSRPLFGHIATRASKHTHFHRKHFWTTHGGMGGVPFAEEGRPGIAERTAATGLAILRAVAGYDSASQREARKFRVWEPNWFEPTNITVAQERHGSVDVKNWMWHHLKQHKVIL